LAAKHFKLSKTDIRTLCEGAVDTIFGRDEDKEMLRSIYENWDGWDGDVGLGDT
jgi:adenosine deaminase